MRSPPLLTSQVPQYIAGGLLPGTEHKFRVRAVNTLGTGGFSEMFTATTKDSVPGRPDGPPKVVGVQSAGKNDLSLLVELLSIEGNGHAEALHEAHPDTSRPTVSHPLGKMDP